MIFLGIDSGTQSTKVVALDFSAGNILAEAQKSYDLISGLPSGHLEQNPSEWIDATGDAIQICLEKIGARRETLSCCSSKGFASRRGRSIDKEEERIWSSGALGG